MSRERKPTLVRHPDFLKLWTAETISQLGTQVTLLALPLTAILLLHATPFQVGVLTAVEFLPFILVGLPAGVWVDRLPRRPILIAGDLSRAVILGSIPLAYGFDLLRMPHLYVAAFLTGICTVFFDVAYQAYLPSLVQRDQLVEGNSKLETSRAGAQLAGPSLAGLLLDVVKAPVAIAVDAASYIGSAFFIFLIRKPEPRVEAPPEGHPRMRTQIGEGLRFVWGNPLLRSIAMCTATANLWGAMQVAVYLLFAVRVLHLKPGAIGVIFAIGNIGFLSGALLARRVADRVGVGRAIVGSVVLFSSAGFLIPLTTPSTAWALLISAWLFQGFGNTVYNINQVSLRQSITSERMQGRMNATMRFIVWGTLPIGAFIGGILGNTLGLRPTLWLAAIGTALAIFPPLFSPVRSLQEIPEAEEEPATAATLREGEDGVLPVEPTHVPPSATGDGAESVSPAEQRT